MIEKLNSFLAPLDSQIRKNEKYISRFLYVSALIWSVYSMYKFSTPDDAYRFSLVSAIHSAVLLSIILWMPIFSRVFGIKIFQTLLAFRQELGIFMGTTAIIHAIFMIYSGFPLEDPLTIFFSFAPQIIIFLLTITSNSFSQKLL